MHSLNQKVHLVTSSKKCFKCKTIKPLILFYKQKNMADGYLNKCKECTKADSSANRLKNIDKVREYDRQRAKNPERKSLCREVNKAWRQEDTRRYKAHKAVYSAIKKGSLVRKNCERCGSDKSLAHHEDYDKPLAVTWLCQPCHKQRHLEIKILLKSL